MLLHKIFIATTCVFSLSTGYYATALVIATSPPGQFLREPSLSPTRGEEDIALQRRNTDAVSTTARPIAVRIRSTREKDIAHISSILASATLESDQNKGAFNFGFSMFANLQRSASFESLLQHRFQAIQEGNKALDNVMQLCQNSPVSDAELMRLIWNREAFRKKLEKAAAMSTEPHLWQQHNFALCPQDTAQLQHAMLTAEDTMSGSVVGFCEVAIMTVAPEHACTCVGLPTIANLVTSPEYRRRGIARSLLTTATRYVRNCWETSSDEIALYVAKDNEQALSLYTKYGFERRCAVDGNKVYMTLRR